VDAPLYVLVDSVCASQAAGEYEVSLGLTVIKQQNYFLFYFDIRTLEFVCYLPGYW
jgi:hypothetical protein